MLCRLHAMVPNFYYKKIHNIWYSFVLKGVTYYVSKVNNLP